MDDQETQADAGWRTRQGAVEKTQADAGWRARQGADEKTQADAGWRARQGADEKTQADAGWRERSDQATAFQGNYSGRISLDDFKNSADELTHKHGTLVSKRGKTYILEKTLSRSGGESAVLLGYDEKGNSYVIKIFYNELKGNSLEARKMVLSYMGTWEGRYYTLAVVDVGMAVLCGAKFYYEVTPYCQSGDLSHDPPYTFEQLVAFIKYMNRALKSIHDAGILHLDIKPQNLFRAPDGHIMLGDFGIARLRGAGATETSLGTDGFRAPETMLAVSSRGNAFIYTPACDYFSLGTTIASLYEGQFVYKGMAPEDMTVYVRDSVIPLQRSDAETDKLRNLLKGLAQYDARRRFTYQDVENWLENHDYTFSAADYDDAWPKSFKFNGEAFWDAESLFNAISKDQDSWDEASELLYSKYFENHFKSFDAGIARAAQLADEQWRNVDRDKGLAIFLKKLFPAGPIVWCGSIFKDLEELAMKMQATRNPANYGELLNKRMISFWLNNTSNITVSPETLDIVEQIEALASEEPEVACYWFGNSFSAKTLTICGKTVDNYRGLLEALFRDPNVFFLNGGYDALMSKTEGAALYGFLYSLGYKSVVEKYWQEAISVSEYNRAVILFSMLEAIASLEGLNTASICRFFLAYGPLGPYISAKKLADAGVYRPFSSKAKLLIESINSFHPGRCSSVGELHRAYMPLIEAVDQLRELLQDNPFSISSGVYTEEDLVCQNLKGCFAFNIMGITAPLYFCSVLERSEMRK